MATGPARSPKTKETTRILTERGWAVLRFCKHEDPVEIRQDLLDEVDGPMLRHGLQDLHGRKLMKLPTRRADRPSRENLAWAYERFREATVADVA